jgi:hypothetical protein
MELRPISSVFPVSPLKVAVALVFLGITGASQAQVTPGSSVIGQPPQGAAGPVIGQPTPGGQTGSTLPQPQSGGSRIGRPAPGAGGPSSTIGSDPSRDSLNRTNREAADIDRDGRLSPEEAARIPPGTPLPR